MAYLKVYSRVIVWAPCSSSWHVLVGLCPSQRMMVDRWPLRRIRSATVAVAVVVVVVVVIVVLVVRVMRVVVHCVGGRSAVHATDAWPVVAGSSRIVSSGRCGGGPRAVGSPCGSKMTGKISGVKKLRRWGQLRATNGRGSIYSARSRTSMRYNITYDSVVLYRWRRLGERKNGIVALNIRNYIVYITLSPPPFSDHSYIIIYVIIIWCTNAMMAVYWIWSLQYYICLPSPSCVWAARGIYIDAHNI